MMALDTKYGLAVQSTNQESLRAAFHRVQAKNPIFHSLSFAFAPLPSTDLWIINKVNLDE